MDTPTAPAETPAAPAVAPTLAVEKLDTAQPLAEIFQPFQITLAKWKEKATSLVVTSPTQKAEMQQARLARLELKDARVMMEKTRKGLVEHLKARTGKIDAAARAIREEMEALETKLLESEQFAERHAAKLKAETKLLREQELAPFMDTPIIGDLSDLSVADYATVLTNAKLARQARIDAALKAEQEAAAKARAEQEQRERIAAENARLKEEAEKARQEREAAEAAAKIERDRIEAERAEEARKAAAEIKRVADAAEAERKRVEAVVRAEQARLQREHEAAQAEARKQAEAAQADAAKAREELRKKQEAEAAEKKKLEAERKAREKAERVAAAAPDKEKLKAFAAAIRAVPTPTLSNAELIDRLALKMNQLNAWLITALDDDKLL